MLIAGLLTASLTTSRAQETAKPAPHIYNPQADAQQDINNDVAKARKHVLPEPDCR
jgi:hypothetical protein